jgi:hypothetical protein
MNGQSAPPSAFERPAVGQLSVKSDPEKVHSADVSMVFVGNSHTGTHDLPGLIGEVARDGCAAG